MLGQRINQLRQAHSWNQVELSKRLNISKQTVSNWENENIQPSIEMLIRLARLFNVSTDYLLGLDERQQLAVDGLPLDLVAHLSLIVQDYRNK